MTKSGELFDEILVPITAAWTHLPQILPLNESLITWPIGLDEEGFWDPFGEDA